MSTDWGFGNDQQPKKANRTKATLINTGILIGGLVLFFVYGIYKLVNPNAEITESGVSIAANIAGLLGVITVIFALVRISRYNRLKTRGY
jgi:hypothetical protein